MWFQAAGIDPFTAIGLLMATILVGFITALVHMVWQVALRTSRFEWRGAIVSSGIIIGCLGALLLIERASWAQARLFWVLATASLLGGALVGRFLGWLARLIITKSSARAYRPD